MLMPIGTLVSDRDMRRVWRFGIVSEHSQKFAKPMFRVIWAGEFTTNSFYYENVLETDHFANRRHIRVEAE